VSNLSQPGEPIWIPLPTQAQQTLLGDLVRLDDLSRRIDVAITTPPAAGSVAAAELADTTQAYAHDLAVTAIRASLDHLGAWRTLLGAGVMPMYAHMSLIRTAHESALVAYWLVEPGVDAATRRTRGIAAQAADYDERRKFEESVGLTNPSPPGKLAVDRLADLIATATQLGLTQLNKRGDPVLKTVVPGTVELFDLYVPAQAPAKGQWLYRFQSGYAHAKQWAMSFGAQQMAPYDSSGRTIALAQGQDMIAVALTQMCVDAVDRALGAYEQLRR
jgi:hypothetical protein